MKYIIYGRKVQKNDRQVLSIEAQLVELKEFATRKLDWCLFQESKPQRTRTNEIRRNVVIFGTGKANGIISWHPDRLARNSVDGGKIIHFVDRGLIRSSNFRLSGLSRHRKGYSYEHCFGQSKYFVDNLRENVSAD